MKNHERILEDLKDQTGTSAEVLTRLVNKPENQKYINSFHSSIYPEGLLSLIETEFESSPNLIRLFFKLYPKH